MADLPTNFLDDILSASMGGKRRYKITRLDGSSEEVTIEDISEYDQYGSKFGAGDINKTNQAVNEKFDSDDVVDPMLATESGYAADAKLTGDAIGELNNNIDSCFQSVSDGKASVASAITEKGVTTAPDATFTVMAANIKAIVVAPKSLSGTVSVGKKTWGQKVNGTVTFSTAFASAPRVQITASGGTHGINGVDYVKTTSVTKAGFVWELEVAGTTDAGYTTLTLTWNAVA